MALLVADSIGKQFGTRKVLTAASVRVVAGKVQTLLGRNGTGKSTLIGIAAGLMAPDYGVILWRGERMMRTRLAAMARGGLMLLPTDGVLAPTMRLGSQLQLIADTFGKGTAAMALAELRLDSLATLFVHQLSGGERRRADLAAALVRAPDCLLADEVFRELAPTDCELVGHTLRAIAARGCAVLITGHEVPFLMRFADGITWCTDGTTHELGAPRDAEKNFAFRQAYLGARVV